MSDLDAPTLTEALGLIGQYAQLWDDRRFDDWIGLFTPDATFDWRGHLLHGHERIQSRIGAGNDARPAGPCMHVMSNTLPFITAGTTRWASDFLYVVSRDGANEIFLAGRTYDRIVAADGGWRLAAHALRFLGEAPPDEWH